MTTLSTCSAFMELAGRSEQSSLEIFATRTINPILKDAAGNALPVGLIDGHAAQVLNQLIAVGITIILAVAGTIVLLKSIDLVIGVRVNEEDELQGLDLSQHGEEGYNLG